MAENDALVGILADNSNSLFSSVSGAPLTEVPAVRVEVWPLETN
jgi:hypothetical protein